MTELDGGDQVRFGQFLGFAFDHDDRVLGRGNDQLALAVLLLLVGRVRDQLAVDAGDTHASDRPCPGKGAHVNRGRRADHREDVGLIASICADDGRDDLRLAHVAVGEERAAGPVDQTRGQHLVIALPGLTLEEATGDLACGVGLFDVVAGQRKERRAGPRLFVSNDRDEDHGLAAAHQYRAGCLLGNTARLEGDLFVTNLNGFSDYHRSLRLPRGTAAHAVRVHVESGLGPRFQDLSSNSNHRSEERTPDPTQRNRRSKGTTPRSPAYFRMPSSEMILRYRSTSWERT